VENGMDGMATRRFPLLSVFPMTWFIEKSLLRWATGCCPSKRRSVFLAYNEYNENMLSMCWHFSWCQNHSD